jgi:hypothetical protein
MPNTTYNLLDDDGLLYAVQYIFTKLKTSPLNVNSTYSLSLDTTNEWIVLTDDQGVSTHVSYSDFGEENVLEGVQIDGTDLTIDANKKVNIPLADGTGGAQVTGAMSGTDKAKLDGIAAGAEVNVVEGAQIDNTDLTITNKKIQIPAAAQNSKGVIDLTTIDNKIAAAVAQIAGISFVKTATLPTRYDATATYAVGAYTIYTNATTGVDELYQCNTAIETPEVFDPSHWTYISKMSGIIFLVSNSGTTPNIYDEYIWVPVDVTTTPITYGFEKIGTTEIDLSGYVQYTDISLITNAEITDIVDDAYDAVFNPTTP